MRLAFYTYSYTDRLQMPLVPALERIAATGYDGIDISGTHGNSADPKSVTPELRRLTRETVERLNLRVEAVITHGALTDSLFGDSPLDLKGSVDLAVDVGAPVVVFHMGGPADEPDRRQTAWVRVVDYVRDAVEYAEAHDVKLASDGISLTWIVDSLEALLTLFDEVDSPSFGVNFDPSYLSMMGFDLREAAQLWKDRVVHGHLKDHIGRHPKWEHMIPGEGELDYAQVVEALKEIGFSGAISIETFTDMAFEKACDVGYETLSAAMGKAV